MNFARQAFVASLWSAVNAYAFFVLNFIGQIILARYLAPNDFGIYAFVLAAKDTAGLFFGLAISMAFIHSNGKQEDYDAAWFLSLIVSGGYLFVGVFIGYFIYLTYGSTKAISFFIICLAQVPLLLANIRLATLEKKLQFKLPSLSRGVSSSVGLYIGILMAWLDYGVWSLVCREIISTSALLFLSFLIADITFCNKVRSYNLKKIFGYSFKMLFSRGSEVLFNRLPSLMIGILVGDVYLGNFYQAKYLAGLPNTVLGPFTEGVSFSAYASVKNDNKKIAEGLCLINYCIVRMLLPISFFVFFNGEMILKLIYGQQWLKAGRLFELFSGFMLCLPVFSNAKTACYSISKQIWVVHGYIISLIVTVISIIIGWRFDDLTIIVIGINVGIFGGLAYLLLRLHLDKISLRIFRTIVFPFLIYIIFGIFSIIFVGIENSFIVWGISTFCWIAVIIIVERNKLYTIYLQIFGKES